jgi:hypothetical protein
MRASGLFPLIALITGLAGAAGAAQPLQPVQLPADTNRDGKISLQEYQTDRRNFLMAADTNHDGKVTKDEWDRAAQRLRTHLQLDGVDNANVIGKGGWWEAIDANGDGVITPDEIDAFTKARFQTLDLNGDGFLDRTEIRKAVRAAGVSPP